MKNKVKNPLWLLACGLMLVQSACSSVLGGASGNSADTGGDLSSTETGFYADGPVDLPVSIAKLESPNLDLISVEVQEVGISNSVNTLLTPLRQTTQPYEMIVTGAALSVSSPTTTPFVRAYYLESDDSVNLASATTVSVNSDGSFSLTIGIPAIDTSVIFLTGNADLSLFSPPTTSIEDRLTRRRLLLTTNSNGLIRRQNLLVNNGEYLLSIANANGTNTLVRRNKNGSMPEELLETTHVFEKMAARDDKYSVIDDAGTLTLLIPDSDIVNELAVLSDYSFDTDKLGMTDSGIFVIKQAANGTFTNFSTVDGTQTDIVRSADAYLDFKGAIASDANQLYALTEQTAGTYTLFRLELASVSTTLWASREQVVDLTLDTVSSIDVSADGIVVFDGEVSGLRKIYLLTCADGCFDALNDPVTDTNTYVNPKINADATLVLACKLGADGEGNQLVYHRVGEDVAGTLNALTNNTDYELCTADEGSYFIDSENRVHFYRTRVSTGISQHGLINLNDL